MFRTFFLLQKKHHIHYASVELQTSNLARLLLTIPAEFFARVHPDFLALSAPHHFLLSSIHPVIYTISNIR